MVNLIRHISNELQPVYAANEARNIALNIVQHITNRSRTQVLANNFLPLTIEQENTLKSFVERLKQHEPVQYVIGSTEFYGLPFNVDKRVLIPRPETEELVEWVIEDYKNSDIRIIDLCTGSGCIAIALAKKIAIAQISAYDLSADALTVAQANAQNNGVNVRFFQADVLDGNFSEYLSDIDVIVSNPPYVLETEKDKMQKNVLDFEPEMALFVKETNPLLFYEAIGKIAYFKLKPKGALYVEINQVLGRETVALFERIGLCNVQLKNDLYGNPRMVKAEKKLDKGQLVIQHSSVSKKNFLTMEIPYDLLLKKAAAYCSRQETAPHDIANKLDTWGADSQQSEKILEYLLEEKYIDNERYCRSFVNDKFRFNKWGKLKISQALGVKRIPSEIVESVLSEMDISLYEQSLLELLTKKSKEVKAASDYEKHGKLINFALQRGFEYAVAERVLKTLKK